MLEKRILNGLEIGVKRDDAIAAGFVGKGNQQADELVVMLARSGEHMSHAAKRRAHGCKRELEEDSAHGAAEDNQGRGGLQDLAEVAALDQQPGNDAGHSQKHSANTGFIH